ncbi:MAG: radical SAM protein [Acidobacteriota bacterium]|nr:radical SAM protein [Acidobacteriota bacterium]
MRPTDKNRELALLERFTETPKRFGAYRIALGFPNSYEIGMSNLGFQWVFRLLNRVPDLVCERFFFEDGEPAVTFETGAALSEFGLLAWSLSWEMDVVNILKTLRAARIPERRDARDERHPVLLVGGDIARMNPAALTPFVDIFALGDGERLVPRIAELAQSGLSREDFLAAAARIPGFFVPAIHGPRAEAAESGKVVIQQPMSRKDITPFFEVPHTTALTPRTELADKLLIEISRGCTEMCRFCWAAYAMAPIKQYPASSILKIAREARPLTNRVGLIATAVCDHPEIETILAGLSELEFHIALSSIKIDAIEAPILEILARQGEKALAIAPEAGNERLRRHINKKVSDAMLREKARLVFAHGFTRLKLYLQVGLPTETDEDVRDIVRTVADLREIAIAEGRAAGRVAQLVPSVNAFIPKPHTPYEDEPLASEESLKEKLAFLQREFEGMGNVAFRGMSVGEAVWEAYLAKMDETGADILEQAASGVPVRRLLKEHRERIAAVVRPDSVNPASAGAPAPWAFISKR